MPEQTMTHTLETPAESTAGGLARLLFIQNGSLFDQFGGIEYYLDDLETDLAQLLGGSQVTAVLPIRKPGAQLTEKEYGYTTVAFRKKGLLAKWENRFSKGLWNAAMKQIERARPTHLVCGHVHLAPLVCLLSMRTRIPYVTCTYGIEAWGDLRWIEEYALSQSDRILTISDWTRQILQKRGYPASQIQVIHPRLPSEFENIPPPRPRAQRSTQRKLRLLTVSRLSKEERYKGQDHVIEALHRILMSEGMLPFEYWIVGDGGDLPRLRDLVERKQLKNHVHFLPPVRHRSELIPIYRKCDVYVMPSRFGKWEGRWRGEGFGIVYLEAAACGLPSVAYACGGVTDIVRHGSNGLLAEPDNAGELSRILWELYVRPDRIDALGRTAYDDVMQRFTRPSIRTEILDWLRNIYPDAQIG
jgi:phosphatidylinositol alpha-1,6-mannosyltransferase